MDDILNRPIVLILNRNWQAIDVRTPQQAFVQMATDVATTLDIDGENMVPVCWAQWIKLPVRENDHSVRTPSGPVRIPHVIVLSRFAKVPKRRPKFSARGIWARDGGRCQYTGLALRPAEGNIDHILPRSRGGKMPHARGRHYWSDNLDAQRGPGSQCHTQVSPQSLCVRIGLSKPSNDLLE